MILLRLLLLCLATSALAEKFIPEGYPWPNAEYPSREKPMRRELSAPPVYSEKEDRPSSVKTPAAKKKPAVKRAVKPTLKKAPPPIIIIDNVPSGIVVQEESAQHPWYVWIALAIVLVLTIAAYSILT